MPYNLFIRMGNGEEFMIIKRGKIEELDEIVNIIKNAVEDMESNGIYQWDEIYPNREVLEKDIKDENLFVCFEDDVIAGIFVLNEYQDKEYEDLIWKYNSGKQLVVHRLCINPTLQGKGIARVLLEYIERYAKENKYRAVRLDAFTQNERACRLYERAGYEKVGVITLRKGNFFCFEKEL